MSNGVRYTPTFAMPSEYEQQAMEARRRRRMAEMLAAQAHQPQDVGVAPIPAAAPLVQGLQAFLTARQLKKAEEAEQKAQQADIEGFRKLLEELGPRSQIAAPTAADIAGSVGMPQISEDGTVSYGQTTMPKLGMESVMPTAEERNRTLETALFTGSPTARKYAELMMAQKPDVEEFYAPTETKAGLVQFGKRGGVKETKFEAAPKEIAPTTLARLQAERAAMLPGDPRIPAHDQAIQSEIGSKTPTTNIITPRDKQQDESRLRDQLEGRLAKMDWFGTQAAMQRIASAPETPAGDVTIVYALAKANDPTGAVRTDDFDKLAKQGSFGQTIKAAYEEAISGRMLPERRQQLIDTALSGYRMR